MRWTKIAVAVLGCAALSLTAAEAPASANGSASLGRGGIATGDISKKAGETDTFTVSLVAGGVLDVLVSTNFRPSIVMTDPDGETVALRPAGTRWRNVTGFAVPKTGAYTVQISSQNGVQGLYTLTVRERWPAKIGVSGAGYVSIPVAMPAGGRIGATISRVTNAPGQPRIISLLDPESTDLLTAPIQPSVNTVTMRPRQVSAAGTYQVVVNPTDGSSRWKGVVTRAVVTPRVRRVRLMNGLSPVSYRQDGVATLLNQRCTPCHRWAGTYDSAKSVASRMLAMIESRRMPPRGTLSDNEILMFRTWVQTGTRP